MRTDAAAAAARTTYNPFTARIINHPVAPSLGRPVQYTLNNACVCVGVVSIFTNVRAYKCIYFPNVYKTGGGS